jgi:hypothetical protein
MDNQTSPELRAAAVKLGLTKGLVPSNQKEPNRSERATQTAKSHIIATRAGFHRDCPHTLLDRMIYQIEMKLNTMHPYEYDPRISAYHGVVGERYDFMRHPIAPAGSKVLTWNSPDTRGSWADHGTMGVYVGPALDHFRAFRIWVPQNSAMRVSATVWWFFPERNERIGWSDIFANLSADTTQRLFTTVARKKRTTKQLSTHNVFDKPMPKPDLPPVFPNRPFNLNEDGTTINY